jgi:hypothetical protein
MHKGLASATLLTTWMMRNNCGFNDAKPAINTLVSRRTEEAKLWARAGITELRVALPMIWDNTNCISVVISSS